jgi:hypothetical protein
MAGTPVSGAVTVITGASTLAPYALQPCPAALQKYYKFNNAGRIASFFTAVGRHAALHVQAFPAARNT